MKAALTESHLIAGLLALALMPAASALAIDKDDVRTFHADGEVEQGDVSDTFDSDLVLYLAGNQFMVMEGLVKDFQDRNPDIKTVHVVTLPPGLLLKKYILKQSELLGEKASQSPDLYASVNLGHLKKLKSEGRMDTYMTYIHNKLTLMVKEGNPKNIEGVQDLTRDDLVKSFPNPETEGIFIFYGSRMLKEAGIYDALIDRECKHCWAKDKETWFTAVHHRETPDGIESGKFDVGIVWASEVAYAQKQGRPIGGVEIPSPLNQAPRVGYAIGALKDAKNHYNAMRFLAYLASDEGQAHYTGFNFVPAEPKELVLKAIPAD